MNVPGSTPAKVAVVIPARDAAQTVGRALDSVIEQRGVRVEVLVVDDGSTDSTSAVISTYVGRVQPHSVRLLRHPGGVNRGVSASRNLGVVEAESDLVAFLDADDCLVEGSLEVRADALRSSQGLVLAYGRVETLADDHRATRTLGRGIAGRPFDAVPWLLFENPIMCSSVMARRTALGPQPFSLHLEHQIEDWLAWLDLCTRGRALFVDRVVARYWVGGERWTSRLSDRWLRLNQWTEEGQALQARLPGALARYQREVRSALGYRTGIVLVEALGRARRLRAREALRCLGYAGRTAGSTACLLRGLLWVPLLKVHGARSHDPEDTPITRRMMAERQPGFASAS